MKKYEEGVESLGLVALLIRYRTLLPILRIGNDRIFIIEQELCKRIPNDVLEETIDLATAVGSHNTSGDEVTLFVKSCTKLIQMYGKKPLSRRLNNFIKEWFKMHSKSFEFVDDDSFEEGEQWYIDWRSNFKKTGKIKVWKGASGTSIYGSPIVNNYARAWHDWCHYWGEFDFTPEQELEVCEMQQRGLPKDWHFEKLLLQAETLGQQEHLAQYGKFPEDQRAFTIDYLKLDPSRF